MFLSQKFSAASMQADFFVSFATLAGNELRNRRR